MSKLRRNLQSQKKTQEKFMFVDVKQAHFSARCDEEEQVELLEDFSQ